MKKINTSISTFKNLIESGYLYVDKTKYIYEMVKEPFGQFFFSRPRRFGKSLTVSTLEAIFCGDKDLFKGYYIFQRSIHGRYIQLFILILVEVIVQRVQI